MKCAIINDTSAWHGGSAAVVAELRHLLREAGHSVVDLVDTPTFWSMQYTLKAMIERLRGCGAELFVFNGEGTMHHDSPTANHLLRLAAELAELGGVCWLVNSLWQDMGAESVALARRAFSRCFFRESWSQKQAGQQGLKGPIRVDCSVNSLVNKPLIDHPPRHWLQENGVHDVREWHGGDGVCGQPRNAFARPPRLYLSLRQNSWAAAWAILVGKSYGYVTGEHHGVLLAGCANVPCLWQRPNSHKVDALYDMAMAANDPEGSLRFSEWLRTKAPLLTVEDLTP